MSLELLNFSVNIHVSIIIVLNSGAVSSTSESVALESKGLTSVSDNARMCWNMTSFPFGMSFNSDRDAHTGGAHLREDVHLISPLLRDLIRILEHDP